MSDDRIILTVDEAISLLPDHDAGLHSIIQSGPILIGCDEDRAALIASIENASSLELGGPQCKAMGHALVVHDRHGRYTFVATDAERVEIMEALKAAAPAAEQP